MRSVKVAGAQPRMPTRCAQVLGWMRAQAHPGADIQDFVIALGGPKVILAHGRHVHIVFNQHRLGLVQRLLNERSKCAIEIGRIKREIGQPVYTPSREKQVIEHVTGVNSGPLDEEGMQRLFERIIDESRRIERVTVELEKEAGEPPAAKTSHRKKRRAK